MKQVVITVSLSIPETMNAWEAARLVREAVAAEIDEATDAEAMAIGINAVAVGQTEE